MKNKKKNRLGLLYIACLKNWEFDKKASQNSDLERATIVRAQGASEDKNFEKKPTQSKTNFSNTLCILLVGALLAWTGHLCLKQTRGFALYKICSSLPFNPEFETSSLSEEENKDLKKALDQPYRFLDKGAQCYVFLSQDGRYVIKFFKLHALQPPIALRTVQLPFYLQRVWVQKLLEKRQSLTKTFTSYKIAFEEMKEETGILFLHLNKTDHLKQKLVILDNLGISHPLDLDKMEFLVQKRASLFYPFLETSIQEQGMEPAKRILSDLVQFLVIRNRKEIFDKDPDLTTNFGFLDGKLIQIDVGRFRKESQRKDPKVYHDEIVRITDLFNKWLKVHYPALSHHLEQEIASLINESV